MSDEQLIERAIRRFLRDCEANGAIPQQPSRVGSYVDDDGEIVLANTRGTLARYRHRTDSGGRVLLERAD